MTGLDRLTFDDPTHTYCLDGKEIRGVSGVLKSAGLVGTYRGTTARDRGTRIHQLTEMMDATGLGPECFDEYQEWLLSWRQFLVQSKAEILMIEQKVYHETLWYAGTMDRLVIIGGKTMVLDIKTGSSAPWHRLQAAAYALAAMELGQQVDGSIMVYIGESKYSTKSWTGIQFEKSLRDWEKTIKGVPYER